MRTTTDTATTRTGQPDAFPDDPSQWADTDGDGYGDNVAGENLDLFPNNPDQWATQMETDTATTATDKTGCVSGSHDGPIQPRRYGTRRFQARQLPHRERLFIA